MPEPFMPLHRLLCSLSSIHRSLALIAQAKSVEEQPKIEVLPSSENEAFGSSVHLPLAEAKPRMGQENHLIPIEFQALAASAEAQLQAALLRQGQHDLLVALWELEGQGVATARPERNLKTALASALNQLLKRIQALLLQAI